MDSSSSSSSESVHAEKLDSVELEPVTTKSPRSKSKAKSKSKSKSKSKDHDDKSKKKKKKKTKKSSDSSTSEDEPAMSKAAIKRKAFLAKVDKSKLVPDSEKVQLSWKNLLYQVPAKERRFARCRGYGDFKTILNNVTGYVAPGEMVAIVGPSGAGKTSLLNVLSRRIQPGTKPNKVLTGSILLNGENPNTQEFQSISGFVAQDDILMGTSTAREALEFAANMTLGDLSKSERKERVDELITMMGLESCQNNFIGFTGQGASNSGVTRGLSGGERKRLSVCVELIHNPRILFCDEPTSGLDSFAANTVIQSLQKLAFLGRSIVCTIHQPSSTVFNMFDKVLVLTGGNVCYFGPPNQAIPYFKSIGYPAPRHVNPADFLLHVVQAPTEKGKEAEVSALSNLVNSKEAIQKVIDAYNDSDVAVDAANPPPVQDLVKTYHSDTDCCGDNYSTSYWKQFTLLTHRSWLGTLREPMLFQARLFQSLFMGVLAGLIYLRLSYDQKGLSDRLGSGFFLIISAMFGGINGPTYVFPAERGVFYREKAANMYSSTMYFLAKLATQTPINILSPGLLATVGWWMIGFNDSFVNYFIFLITAFLVNNLGFALGILLSCAILDPGLVETVQPVILLPFMLFGGFFLSPDSIPSYFRWIEYLSFVKYSFRITTNVALRDTTYWCGTKDFREYNFVGVPLTDPGIVVGEASPSISICPITTGEQMLDVTGLNYDDGWYWWIDYLILVAMYVAFLVVSWFLLRFRKPKV